MSRRRGPASPVKITQPKKLPGEVAWVPDYSYDCTAGHFVQSDKPVTRCPACHHGERCDGQLVPVGKGSRRRVAA